MSMLSLAALCALTACSLNVRPAIGAPPNKTKNTPTCEDPVGVWHNQIGSTLTITSLDPNTRRIEGEYISPHGTQGDARPLVGWVNGSSQTTTTGNDHVARVVTFTVDWGPYTSLAAWTGYCNPDEKGFPKISTLWHLVRPDTKFDFEHIVTNADTFTQGPPAAGGGAIIRNRK
jgi:hypothetical protein